MTSARRIATIAMFVGSTFVVGHAQSARPPGPVEAPAAAKPGATRATAPAGVPASAIKDWPGVGNDPGGSKFSALTQITPENVTQLKTAWTYDFGAPMPYTVTPIVAGNVMYFPLQTSIIALKADTGAEIWKSDLKLIEALGPNPSAGGRGISIWPGTPATGPRIVISTTNGFLVQLNAKTGKVIAGPTGVINLSPGVMDKFGGAFSTQTAPVIYKNLAIIAGRTGEAGRYGIPGDPRAFNLVTGKEVWRFPRRAVCRRRELRHVGPERLAGSPRALASGFRCR
jgi:quinoprotein glucose dehydrogenase